MDQTAFDDAGRRTTLVENYVDGDPTTGTPDQDRTTIWTYTPDGAVATLTAVNPATGDQKTTYVYGTTLADSGIATSMLKRSEVYPDSVGGSDQVAFTYDRQQEVTSLTDQNGTAHAYDYDLLGRRTEDRITTLGTGVDGAVLRIGTAYEVRSMVQTITSYDNATVAQGNVVNQAQFAYNDFGQLVTDYQEHSGAVDVSTTLNVRYGYADGSANTVRPTSLTYPNGRVLTFDYGTAGGANDAASRIASIIENASATHLADYSYLGAGTVVEVDHPQPQVQFTLINLTGGNDPDTGDIYSGLDRFGRIKDNRWYNAGIASDADRIQYGYDRVGNRLWRQNNVAESLGKGFDELYSYDGLYRLATMQRGTLSADQTAITGRTFAQSWSLDPTGNWSGFDEDDNGDGTWDLVQSRTANRINKITSLVNSTGPTWMAPAYDLAGNMTTAPISSSPTQSSNTSYDAWNRQVHIVDTTGNVLQYQYDGAKRRTVVTTNSSGVVTETRQLYYTAPSRWQVIEERLGSVTTPDRQFVWGQRYVDDLVLRDRGNERLYTFQDANWNVTAIADAGGLIQERYSYLAYGVPSFLTGNFAPLAGSSYAWETLYAGYRYEAEAAVFPVRNRVYHPELGVWMQRDPFGLWEFNRSVLNFSTGQNTPNYSSNAKGPSGVGRPHNVQLYEYIQNNPLRSVDPSGLLPCERRKGPVGTGPWVLVNVGASSLTLPSTNPSPTSIGQVGELTCEFVQCASADYKCAPSCCPPNPRTGLTTLKRLRFGTTTFAPANAMFVYEVAVTLPAPKWVPPVASWFTINLYSKFASGAECAQAVAECKSTVNTIAESQPVFPNSIPCPAGTPPDQCAGVTIPPFSC